MNSSGLQKRLRHIQVHKVVFEFNFLSSSILKVLLALFKVVLGRIFIPQRDHNKASENTFWGTFVL